MTDVVVDERLVAKGALEAAQEQLQSLCASHAGTFVAVERRGKELETALSDLLAVIQNTQTQVETSQQALEQEEADERSLAALSEKHRVRRRTLLQHSSLLELLELPSLMDACVRSNLYDEALSIAAFSNTLERRHTEQNPVVVKVIQQIRARQSDLRRQLLFSLKQHVTMPQCLEIVTSLRRLNAIDLERQSEANLERVHAAMEWSLQIDFLEARTAWLDQPSTSSSTSTTSVGATRSVRSSEQLLDTVERYRTRVFEIATQFNAIFRAQRQQTSGDSLLSMWVSRTVHGFLSYLQVQLRTTAQDSASLRDTLDASVFFATSMGRLGADFTALLPPILEHKMHELVVQCWTTQGVTPLEETLKVCREAGVAAPLVSTTTSSSTTASSSNTAGDGALAASNHDNSPPRLLMTLPPLGRLVNAILTGLNELRRCLLPGIFSRLRASLEDVLAQCKQILATNERAVLTPGLRGEAAQLRQAAKDMKQMFADICEPYLRGALELALGNQAASQEFFAKMQAALPVETPKEEEQEAAEEEEEENKPSEPAIAASSVNQESETNASTTMVQPQSTSQEPAVVSTETPSSLPPIPPPPVRSAPAPPPPPKQAQPVTTTTSSAPAIADVEPEEAVGGGVTKLEADPFDDGIDFDDF